jgi:hypothetical protein
MRDYGREQARNGVASGDRLNLNPPERGCYWRAAADARSW